MHVTNNVFDNIIATLLDKPRKMNCRLKSCKNLVQFGLRPKLHPILRSNGKHYLPSVSYSPTVEEKKAFCQCLHGVRVATDFSSNITKLVSVKDLSMSSYHSHDCHMMMMVFLAITVKAIKLMYIKVLITCLCYFFDTISQKVIGRKELDDVKAYMIETMCMIEMCFSPYFFDMQEHLMIYLMDQILTLDPLYLHSMFPYERLLAVLKAYVRNRPHPEGCIMESYTIEEVVKCRTDYVKDQK
jgi:hypothetical protein